MKIEYQGQQVDLTPPWPRITMIDAVNEHGVNFNDISSDEEARGYEG